MLPIERNTTKTTKHSRQCKKHACKKTEKQEPHPNQIHFQSFIPGLLSLSRILLCKIHNLQSDSKETGQSSSGLPTAAKELNAVSV